ncbi:MAG: MATE family efflux transporter [Abditibacteriota bacterium]|nr:MATE family efflux transporter [Abditibacteriota bacterium]
MKTISNIFDKSSCKAILTLAWPLILSTCSNVIQQFVDKIFLAQYSQEALAAVMPAGMLVGAVVCFFTGTVGYVSNFIAQYRGAHSKHEIPVMINQALIVSLVFGLVVALFSLFPEFIFVTVAKHDLSLAYLETEYFKPMIYCAFLPICMSSIAGFFVGIEKSHVILWVSVVCTVFNIIFDYIFIFGKFGVPEMGVAGAAWATQIATALACVIFFVLYYSKYYHNEYNTRIKWKIRYDLIKKLFYYGVPSGIQITMDLLIWTMFILLIGRMSVVELAATNIAFQVDSIAFMPILGIGTAVSILVANELGKEDKKSLGATIKNALLISAVIDFVVLILFLTIPKILIRPFINTAEPDLELIQISVNLLRICSIYIFVDGFGIILASVLRGAGDTLFIMWTMFICGIFIIVLPAYYATVIHNVYFGWFGCLTYLFVICFIFYLRVKAGKWKKIKIIA